MNIAITKHILILLTLCFAVLFLSTDVTSQAKETTTNDGLLRVHTLISKRYGNVSHVTAGNMANMDGDTYVIFDVREKDEYAVSHIENAIWVDPSISASTFYEQFGAQIIDKKLILYCSVGVRSTQLADKLMASNIEQSEFEIYNLENGIFGWHNESRPLFRFSNTTDFIHPYNSVWGLMVNRKEFKRYKTE